MANVTAKYVFGSGPVKTAAHQEVETLGDYLSRRTDLTRRSFQRVYQPGDTIYSEGDSVDAAILVKQGYVKSQQTFHDVKRNGKRFMHDISGRGDVLLADEAVMGRKSPVELRAMKGRSPNSEQVLAFEFPREYVMQLLDDPLFCFYLCKYMANQSAQLECRLADILHMTRTKDGDSQGINV